MTRRPDRRRPTDYEAAPLEVHVTGCGCPPSPLRPDDHGCRSACHLWVRRDRDGTWWSVGVASVHRARAALLDCAGWLEACDALRLRGPVGSGRAG